MKGWTMTVLVDAPDNWDAKRVSEETDAVLGGARLRTDMELTLAPHTIALYRVQPITEAKTEEWKTETEQR